MKLKMFLSLLFISLTVSLFVFIKPPQNTQKTPQLSPSPSKSTNSLEPVNFVHLYQDPAVIHLRKALNNYLSGSSEGIVAHGATTGNSIMGGHQLGLGSFDRDYYKSEFMVVNFERKTGSEFTMIDIIFVDKPDRNFRTMIESNNNQYFLIAFGELKKLSSFEENEFIRMLNKR